MKLGELLPGLGEFPEIGGKGDAGQLAFQVGCIFLTVLRVMQDGIDIVENIQLGNTVVLVVLLKLS